MTQTELVEAMAVWLAAVQECRNSDGPPSPDADRAAAKVIAGALDQAHRAGELAMRVRAGTLVSGGVDDAGIAGPVLRYLATAISALEPEGIPLPSPPDDAQE